MAEEHGGSKLKYKTILYEKKGNTGTVTLNRPQALNAIDSQLSRELVDIFEKIDDDDDLRAVIVTGAGGRAFSVGMDIKELVDAAEGVDDQQTLMDIRRRLWNHNPCKRLASSSKPTIAAIQGLALGGGLELALACDIRVASDEAKFGFPEVHLGIIPAWGGTQRLPRIVGRAKAIEMILTGETIDAGEAYRTELVSKIVPAHKLLTTATAIASKLSSNAPIAIRLAREAVARGLDMTIDQALRVETDLYVLLQTTEDRSEGLRSFAEKRRPKFTGR